MAEQTFGPSSDEDRLPRRRHAAKTGRRDMLAMTGMGIAWGLTGCRQSADASPSATHDAAPSLPIATYPGPPDAALPSVGLFAKSGVRVPPGVHTVRTTGWSKPGRGAAAYREDADFAIALHPRAGFRAADGRLFHLTDDAALSVEMVGAAGDLSLDGGGKVTSGTNDTAAFVAASAWIERGGGGTIHCRPGAGYLVGEQHRGARFAGRGDAFAWGGQPIVRIADVGGRVVIEGHGASLKMVPGYRYGVFDAGTGEPNPTRAPYAASAAEQGFPYVGMIDLQRCRGGFVVRRLRLDGSGDTLVLGGEAGDLGRQINGCGLYTLDNEGPVLVEDVECHHQPWDGWLMRHRGPASVPGSGPTVRRFHGHHNGRQAMSLTGGSGGVVVASRFVLSGQGVGLASAPAAGLDIEPEGGATVRDWRFEECLFGGGVGVALLASVNDAADLSFVRCGIHGAREIALWPGKPGMTFDRCTVTGMTTAVHPATLFSNCRFSDDPALSPFGLVHLSAGQILLNLSNAARARLDRCRIERQSDGIALYCDQQDAVFDGCSVGASGRGQNVIWGRWTGRNTITVDPATRGSAINGSFAHVQPGATLLINGRPM